MELAAQLEERSSELRLLWAPRTHNQEADDLTNQKFEAFDPKHRVTVDDLGLEDLGRDKGKPRSISGGPAKTAQQAERLAAARADMPAVTPQWGDLGLPGMPVEYLARNCL